MASTIIPFIFQAEHTVRVVKNGELWFIASDICRVLGIKNVAQAVATLDSDEKGICPADTLGGSQDMIMVAESGLYALFFRSRKPIAKVFRKWVTSEVLPSIRKTGGYKASKAPDAETAGMTDAAKLAKVRECRLTFDHRAAQKMWVELGLETVPEMFVTPRQVDLWASVIEGPAQ